MAARRNPVFGREGGREGAFEYLKPKFWKNAKQRPSTGLPEPKLQAGGFDLPTIDRTAKLYIGGKQARPDGNYSRPVVSPKGR